MPTITVDRLAKVFAGHTAVNDISFSIPDGSFTTLLGPSGCGKTTTLRMLAGLERPTGGSITIGDTVVADESKGIFVPVEHRNVGVVFQSYALWPHMTVFEQVAYPLQVRKQKKAEVAKRVMSALDMVQLAGKKDRYPSELSGGQQQRVALARALVFDPSALFLDEPLSNLDAALRTDMRNELARLHSETGMTTVFVTHDQTEALTLSDQIFLLRDGSIVERGAPAKIYQTPNTVYGARFVGGANCVPSSLVEVNAGMATVKLPNGESLVADAGVFRASDVGATVAMVIRPEDVTVQGGEPVRRVQQITGTVVRVAYYGSHRELDVTIGESRMKVHAAKDAPVEPGDVVSMGVTSARILAMEDAPAREDAGAKSGVAGAQAVSA